jgi:hypothetical protein
MQNVSLRIYDSAILNLQVEKVIKSWCNVLKSERQIGSYGGENNNERKDISDSLRNNPLLDKHIKPECNYPCFFARIDR